jgi:hypothetical protein
MYAPEQQNSDEMNKSPTDCDFFATVQKAVRAEGIPCDLHSLGMQSGETAIPFFRKNLISKGLRCTCWIHRWFGLIASENS